MKRAITIACLLGILVVTSGCMAVVGNKGGSRTYRQAVVVNGEIYVVGLYSGTVEKIDPEAVETAPILAPKQTAE
ncbi:MAG: kelch repeat-containing protein [Planctomycetota bacterium]